MRVVIQLIIELLRLAFFLAIMIPVVAIYMVALATIDISRSIKSSFSK